MQIASTHKPSSCKNYSSSFRSFYRFLDKNQFSLKQLKRKQITPWFQALHQQGLAPATRQQYLVCVRNYLRWMHEQGLVKENPNQLIRHSDIPKRPIYLPRPLPREIDIELSKRLKESDFLLHKGLLLMRYTGIRVGELISLPLECTYTDHSQRTFLKVPLGKLDNERLVPLDQDTIRLIKDIQNTEKNPRSFLFQTKQGK